jgi:hypothetical protein
MIRTHCCFPICLRFIALGLIIAISTASAQQSIDLRSARLTPGGLAFREGCRIIGDGTDGFPLGLDRVLGSAIGAEGAIFVLNFGSKELLRFTSAGRFDRVVMRPGNGPGELRPGNRIDTRAAYVGSYRGDSLLVFDASARRFTIMAADGKFVRNVSVPSKLPGSGWYVASSTGNGDILIWRSLPVASPTTIRFRDSIHVARLKADGGLAWDSAGIEDAALLQTTAPVQTGRARGGFNLVGVQRIGAVAVMGEFFAHYDERTNELHAFGPSGKMVYRILLPSIPRAASGTYQSLFMLTDQAGRVWLEVPRTRDPADREWWVISSDGRSISTIQTPAKERLVFVGTNAIVFKASGTDDVQLIKTCPIARP